MSSDKSQPFLFSDESLQGRTFDLNEVASALRISTATARNWVKSGQLQTIENSRLTFDAAHIQEVKHLLEIGSLERLQKRANKKTSKATFIPDEYCVSESVADAVTNLAAQFKQGGCDCRSFLAAIVNRLVENHSRSKLIQRELEWWSAHSKASTPIEFDAELARLQPDFPGLVYQSILAEGAKSEAGSYYTPPTIARAMLTEHVNADSTFLDPCCGTGLFLLKAAELIHDPHNIWGYDIDETAVHIARMNLALRFPRHDFVPNIFCRSGLEATDARFDVIATNPPWGMHFTKEELSRFRQLYDTQTNESFAFFILACLRSLKPSGSMSILLPQSFMNIRAHREMRRTILENTSVTRVEDLGRIFKKVFTPVVRIDLEKRTPDREHSVIAVSGGSHRTISQDRFSGNSGCVFDIVTLDDDRELLSALYRCDHLTLKGHADWALGIVTGNNRRFVIERESEGAEPVWSGKDVRRFVAKPARQYLRFMPEVFQQVAPEWKYRAEEKLVYKFISNELVFAYDDCQTLTLNSANILLPRLPGYSVKTTLALLNSTIFQFIFRKRFNAIKVLRGDLEQLPFPRLSTRLSIALTAMVDALVSHKTPARTRASTFASLNSAVMDAFCLSPSQRRTIEDSFPKASDPPKRLLPPAVKTTSEYSVIQGSSNAGQEPYLDNVAHVLCSTTSS